MHRLGACLIFRDAALYLEEWIRFHLAVGFEHFYLYDNESADDFADVLEPFISAGMITLYDWPGFAPQRLAYEHCLENCRGRSRWLAFLDDDEFLLPVQAASVPEVLRAYENYAGVAISWLLFGSNGHEHRPEGFVTENYTRRARWIDPHVKCIVNPQLVRASAILGHSFHCLPGESIVNENFQPMSGPFSSQPTAEKLCVNHYLIKSHDELRARRSRPCCNGAPRRSLEEWRALDADYSDLEDLRALRFPRKIRAALAPAPRQELSLSAR